MVRNGFKAKCERCDEQKAGCATCAVDGTNAYGDRDVRVVVLCGECRRTCRGRCRLHPKHKAKASAGG